MFFYANTHPTKYVLLCILGGVKLIIESRFFQSGISFSNLTKYDMGLKLLSQQVGNLNSQNNVTTQSLIWNPLIYIMAEPK